MGRRAREGGDDHGQLRAGGGVAVAAGAAHDGAAGIGVDVDVEAQVHLGGAQQHHIQAVHGGALGVGGGIVHGGDLAVVGVLADGLHRLQVKALDVQQLLEAAGVEHIHHVAGDAAQAEGAVDVVPEHDILEELGGSQGCAAGAGLEGEAVLEEAAGLDDPGGGLGHHKAHGIAGDLGGAGDDAGGIADGFHGNHIINIGLVDGALCEGIGHQIVGDDDDLFGVHGVGEGVAQGAAGGSAGLAGAVAHGVGGGSRDKGNIDGSPAGDDVGGAAAVGAELHRRVHDAGGNGPAHARGHVVAAQLGDHAAANVVDQGPVAVKDGGGVDGEVFHAHLGQLLHDHVQNEVAVAHMVVEGHRHAAFHTGQPDGLP